MNHDIYIYLLVMSAVTLAIRILPVTLIRRPIKNQFLRSFLFYFPAIIDATRSPYAGLLALLVGISLAWKGFSLFKVAAACCIVVFGVELILL